MALKKCISAIIVSILILGGFPFADINNTKNVNQMYVNAVDSTSVDDFLNSAMEMTNTEIVTDSSFNMNGRTYYQGLILKGHYGNENWCTASFNVDDYNTLSFTLGHIDDANDADGILNIYIDNVFYDSFSLNKYMNLLDIEIDVSDASVIRFNVSNPGSYQEGTYGITDIQLDSVSGKSYQVPDYNDIDGFITQSFNIAQIETRTSDDNRNAFNMNGRTYYQGVILNGHYGNENWCTASYNVENIDTFSFTLGHIDDANDADGVLNIYIDNVFYETISLNKYMNLMDIKIDVSDASVIRFNVSNPGSYQEGTYGMANIQIDSVSGKSYQVPNYNDIDSFITQAFNAAQIEMRTSDDKRNTFNMNGNTYNQGIILNGHYGNENWCTASFNVENFNKFSFTLGHVDDANGDDGVLNIYIDNVFYDTVSASKTENFKKAFTEYVGKNAKTNQRGVFTREQLKREAARVAQSPHRKHRSKERKRETHR